MDVASKYAIYETIDGVVNQRSDIAIAATGELQRVEKLKELGVTTIICGAVSGCVARMIAEKGIRLLPMIYGSIDEIVELYLSDTLLPYDQAQSGHACRSRQRRGRCSGRGGSQGSRARKREETSK